MDFLTALLKVVSRLWLGTTGIKLRDLLAELVPRVIQHTSHSLLLAAIDSNGGGASLVSVIIHSLAGGFLD